MVFGSTVRCVAAWGRGTTTGSASVGLLNNVTVKLYGANCELHTVARVFKQNDNILNVQPYDPKVGHDTIGSCCRPD